MPTEPSKTLIIPSRIADAHKLQQTVMAEVGAAGFSDEAVFAVRLALDEALSNAVRHGNRLDASKHVTVHYAVTPQRVCITVEDEGPGFDPNVVPDPTCDENLDRPHGRGLMLMRAYMTDVQYNPQGNRVTMVKHRDCPLPKSGSSPEGATTNYSPKL